jgi:hypothetical protein
VSHPAIDTLASRALRQVDAEIGVAADALMQSGVAVERLSIIHHLDADPGALGGPIGLAVDGIEVFRVSWRADPDRPLTWHLYPIWIRPLDLTVNGAGGSR